MTRWQRMRDRISRLPRTWWMAFIFGMSAAMIIRWWGLAEEPAEIGGRANEQVAGESGLPAAIPRDPAAESPADDKAAAPSDAVQAWGPLARVTVRVWLSGEQRVETVPLELYVRGVLAGEMPPDFEEEALKAQAVAARTYIVKRLQDRAAVQRNGVNADVDDTENSQVYVPLKRLLASRTKDELSRLNRAVMETAAEIVTYKGEPIQAAFFSTSNGYTENSEDYWHAKLPYLRSVPSPWDAELSPRYKDTVEMTLEEFYKRLGLKRQGRPAISVEALTTGKRIKTLTVDGKAVSGREARERLGLRSSQFTWSVEGGSIRITTYGNGHGVGMSQWGADGLAKEGRTARDILEYYYTGAKVERISTDRL